MQEKRIAILGISGSGNSTFSRKLSEKVLVPLSHMDLLFWKENWEAVPEDQYLKLHEELLQRNAWIIEGYIDKSMSNRVHQADLILYLDYSGILCVWRAFLRVMKFQRKVRPELPAGCYDHFSGNFLWVILTRAERKGIEEALEGVEQSKIKRFAYPRQLDSYLRALD